LAGLIRILKNRSNELNKVLRKDLFIVCKDASYQIWKNNKTNWILARAEKLPPGVSTGQIELIDFGNIIATRLTLISEGT
jgi:hypothetical protein